MKAVGNKTSWLSSIRLRLVEVALLGGLAAIAARAVQVQIANGDQLRSLAQEQHFKELELNAPRGDIYDKTGRPLAVSVEVESVYVNPRKFVSGNTKALAKVLGMKSRSVKKRIGGRKSFAWIKRRVTPQEAKKVRALDLPGVHFTKESKRFYPSRELAAHVLGFVGLDGNGLAGVELKYDSQLRSRTVDVGGLKDARGRKLSVGNILPVRELEGDNLYLTIDTAIQELTEETLAETVARFEAVAGTVVVLDPRTNAVLALATVPTFNPNDAGKARARARRNRAITDVFEPGSTMKPLVVAAAMAAGLVGKNDVLFCEDGAFAVGSHTIRDTHAHGDLTVTDVIAKSSNICALKIGGRLGAEKLYNVLRVSGFGTKTGIELPGEVAGLLAKPQSWSQARLATISFGQGIGVTALQMAVAISAIANGGLWRQPYIVDRVVVNDGTLRQQHQVGEARRIIDQESAATMANMMEHVTLEGGTGQQAAIAGIRVAGKTGTAQKVDAVTGGYSADKWVASFVGFAPVENPRVLAIVIIDEPKGSSYGGVVAAPAFRKIVRGTLRHLGVNVAASQQVQNEEQLPRSPEVVAIVDPRPQRKTAVAAKGIMPDLIGLDARRAAAGALTTGLQLHMEGRGLVVEQHPSAGSRLGEAVEIRLRLAKGQG